MPPEMNNGVEACFARTLEAYGQNLAQIDAHANAAAWFLTMFKSRWRNSMRFLVLGLLQICRLSLNHPRAMMAAFVALSIAFL